MNRAHPPIWSSQLRRAAAALCAWTLSAGPTALMRAALAEPLPVPSEHQKQQVGDLRSPESLRILDGAVARYGVDRRYWRTVTYVEGTLSGLCLERFSGDFALVD